MEQGQDSSAEAVVDATSQVTIGEYLTASLEEVNSQVKDLEQKVQQGEAILDALKRQLIALDGVKRHLTQSIAKHIPRN